MSSSVVVWDEITAPTATTSEVLYWKNYSDGPYMTSVPCYLEANADRLRAKYLAFVHDLGEHRIGDRRVVDHLDIGDGFSLWWMTQVAEKSPLKSPRIYDCLLLIALEEMLGDRKPSDLLLVSSDKALVHAMQRLCQNLQIGFRWQGSESGHGRLKARRWLRDLYHALPYPIQGLVGLRHLVMRWPLRKLMKPQWFSGDGTTCLFSYFIHLDPASCEAGVFHSRQWGPLPNLLHDTGNPTNWIHHFLVSRVVPDMQTGRRWLQRFNHDATEQGYHSFIESYLSGTVVIRVLRHWLRLTATAWRLRHVSDAFTSAGSAVWLWPMLREDWLSSLTGPVAMKNCLWVELFDAALADMPYQSKGLYLCENQGWERALLRAWRRHGHGEIIGVPHATVPFWHLYYFDDPRTLTSVGRCAMPLPDRLAVNGPAAWNALTAAGYRDDQLVEVEALVYLNLARLSSRRALRSEKHHRAMPLGPDEPRDRVLVVGDMLPSAMDSLLKLLEETTRLLPQFCRLTLKAHPAYPIRLADYPGLRLEETTEALDKILDKYDLAIAATTTSAAVDAYQAGLQVVVQLDGSSLNLSPLRGQTGVRFVSKPEELAEALQSSGRAVHTPEPHAFFFLDPELPRWKHLLPSTCEKFERGSPHPASL